MAHKVKCIYCKTIFDRDKFPFVQISQRRFSHKECAVAAKAQAFQEEQDKLKLENYIEQLLADSYVPARVHKQINQFVNDYNFTYSGIYKALVYFYEVQKHPIEKANGGIGIVPYVYKDAYNYYYSLWLANQKNEDKDIEDYIPKEKVVTIINPERKIKKRKLFSFLDEEEVADGE